MPTCPCARTALARRVRRGRERSALRMRASSCTMAASLTRVCSLTLPLMEVSIESVASPVSRSSQNRPGSGRGARSGLRDQAAGRFRRPLLTPLATASTISRNASGPPSASTTLRSNRTISTELPTRRACRPRPTTRYRSKSISGISRNEAADGLRLVFLVAVLFMGSRATSADDPDDSA